MEWRCFEPLVKQPVSCTFFRTVSLGLSLYFVEESIRRANGSQPVRPLFARNWIPRVLRCYRNRRRSDVLGDAWFWFCLNLITFAQMSPQFCPNLIKLAQFFFPNRINFTQQNLW